MSNGRPARYESGLARFASLGKGDILLLLLLVLGGTLYLHRAFQCFMIDDEGSYAYAAWRTSAGEVPYRDFLTPQMPLFAYWGGLIVRLFGRSFVALRLANVAVMLLAAYFLYAANREIFGYLVAILSTAVFLAEPSIYHSARHFRPEAHMLLFQLAGVYAFVLGEKRGRLWYVGLAGVLFGFSILSKLFGALPLAGCFAYLAFAWRRERRPLRQVLRQGLTLALPAVLLVGVAALIFTRITPYFLTAVFEHHTMQGAGMALAERVGRALGFYGGYVSGQWLVIGLSVLGACLTLSRDKALPSLLVWQVPTALVFLVLSRELLQRHLAYLAPSLATLVAVALARLPELQRHLPSLRRPWRAIALALLSGLGLALALAAVRPWMDKNAFDAAQQEQDSPRLATLIRSLASDDELVMADYPGLNFLAGRRSTYWAAGLSGGAAQSGQVRGAALIDEIERQNVAVVIINTWGGAPQMAAMIDYPEFRRYVWSHFTLVDRYECTYSSEELEIYCRPDRLRLKPGLGDQEGKEAALPPLREGATIELRVRPPESGTPAGLHWKELWTIVQWQDGLGAWHDVEGWQAPLERVANGELGKVWAVGPKDLGSGPFRWVILRGPGGAQVASSEPFHMPLHGGEITRVQVTLSP